VNNDDDQNWNPRYVYYAKAHGHSPEEQFEFDKEAYTGCMIDFMLWMNEKKAEFYEAHPEACMDRHAISDDAAWDDFLRESVE